MKRTLFILMLLLSTVSFAYGRCDRGPEPYISYEGWRCLMQERSQKLDVIRLKDGRTFRGTLETRPDLHYSFGCVGFENGEASVYAFNRGCSGEKVQVITYNGRSFVARPDSENIVFAVYKPYQEDAQQLDRFHRSREELDEKSTNLTHYGTPHQDNATECYNTPYGYGPQQQNYYGYQYQNQQPQQGYEGGQQGYYYGYGQQQQQETCCNYYDHICPYETPVSACEEQRREHLPSDRDVCQYQYDSTTGHYAQYNYNQQQYAEPCQQGCYTDCGQAREQGDLCYAGGTSCNEDGCDTYYQDCSQQPNVCCDRTRNECQTETRVGICTDRYERLRYEFTPEEVDYVITHEGKRCVFAQNRDLFSIEMTNGDQVPAEICGKIRVNNGFNEMCVTPEGSLEMRMAGGARNRYTFWDSLPRSFEHVVVQDAYLDVKVANDKRLITLPWKNILGIQGDSGSFSSFANGMPPCYPCGY